MEIDVELNERVAKEVMGWHLEERWQFDERYIAAIWNPSAEIADAWKVHKAACSWPHDEYVRYLKALRDAVIERIRLEATEGTPKNVTVEWPHVLANLEPIDICNAALRTKSIRKGEPGGLRRKGYPDWVFALIEYKDGKKIRRFPMIDRNHAMRALSRLDFLQYLREREGIGPLSEDDMFKIQHVRRRAQAVLDGISPSWLGN